jgi:shikimate kinase
MMVPNIILTGFMGTGKTAVGQRLAVLLSFTFIDTDQLIEKRDGRSIHQIFAESGEATFRVLEREAALELAEHEGLIISTGGKLMLDPINAAALMKNGRVFCLTANPEEILKRISGDGSIERPLLAGEDPAGRISSLLAERQSGYSQFEQITTDGKRPEEVAREILKIVMNGM